MEIHTEDGGENDEVGDWLNCQREDVDRVLGRDIGRREFGSRKSGLSVQWSAFEDEDVCKVKWLYDKDGTDSHGSDCEGGDR